MKITIKDIARVAGVSYSTVSKALNNSPLVKQDTKNKIIKLAEEMGYEPNFAAQQLVSKQSKVIGLIWPTFKRVAPSTLLTKVNDEITKNGYSMIVSIDPVKTSFEMFKRFNVDGVILFYEQNYLDINYEPLPIVTYGVANNKKVPVIDVGYQEAMRVAVDYLYKLGHRDISFVGDFTLGDDRQLEKYNGFIKAMNEYGLSLQTDQLINTSGLDWYDGYMATSKLLNSSYSSTAIIGGSYDISAGIVRALRETNTIIPKDISVISYDNIPQMDNLEIPLTSVGVPVDEIAYHIAHTLLNYIQDKDSVAMVQKLTPVISERNSCAHAPISI